MEITKATLASANLFGANEEAATHYAKKGDTEMMRIFTQSNRQLSQNLQGFRGVARIEKAIQSGRQEAREELG